MKTTHFFSTMLLAAMVALSACGPKNPPVGPTPGPGPDTTKTDTTAWKADTTGWNIPAGAITVAEARTICAALDSGALTSTAYYVKGFVKKTAKGNAESITSFGNASFYMIDKKGDTDDFYAFQVLGPDSKKITDTAAVAVGDYVVVYGKLTNYGGTYETENKGKAYVWRSTNSKMMESKPIGSLTGDGSVENPFTVADIKTLGSSQAGPYYIKAFIVGQSTGTKWEASTCEFAAPFTPASGQTYNTNIIIADAAGETNYANCVPVQLPSGALRTGLNLPENPTMLGKELLIYATLETYFGTDGVKNGSYAKVDSTEFGTKPVQPSGKEYLVETLLTQASFDKFTAVSVKGDQVWSFDSKYGAKMSGFVSGSNYENEDWFITPAMDLSKATSATVSFNHAFGPKGAIPSTDALKANYTVWVSNDFSDDVTKATWTEIKGMAYGTTAWGYVASGELAIPQANLAANCRIAWKYLSTNTASGTWEVKEVVVK